MRMSQLEKIRDYWNMRGEGFSLSNMDQLNAQETRELWLTRLKKYAPEGERLKCLDIGCGPGIFSILLAGLEHEVCAIDYTENMLKEAEKNAGKQRAKISFFRMDAQSLDFEDESYDYIVTRNVTWNLEQPEKAYAEWLRVLKPGGHLVNFDGNHNRHKNDPLYAEYRSSDAYVDPHKKEYVKDVDLSVMERISRYLPLSSEERPNWDCDVLIKLGVSSILLDINRARFFSKKQGKLCCVVDGFCICAIK